MTMAAPTAPELDIVLFNMHGKTEYGKQVDVPNSLPAFVVSLDKMSEKDHTILCETLKKHMYRRNEHSAMYYHWSEQEGEEQFVVSFVDQDSLEKVKKEAGIQGDDYFTVTRLVACVFVPTLRDFDDKILLVSWRGHGPDEYTGREGMKDFYKHMMFVKLVYFLECLKKAEGCRIVIAAGDFNMSEDITTHFLKAIRPEGKVVPIGRQGGDSQSNQHIIYWPSDKLKPCTAVENCGRLSEDKSKSPDSSSIIVRFELPSTAAAGSNGDFCKDSCPKFGILLLNGQSRKNEEIRQKATRYILGRLKDDFSRPLFLLCHDTITEAMHRILCDKFRNDYPSYNRSEEAGVYYRPSERYKVTRVDNHMMTVAAKEVGNVTSCFRVDNVMVCVLKPSKTEYGGILLVSWTGPKGTVTEKVFVHLFYSLNLLKVKMKCEVVVMGGDFNLPDLNGFPEVRVLEDSTPSQAHIVFWPSEKLQRCEASLRSYTNPHLQFNHNIFAYTFEVKTMVKPKARKENREAQVEGTCEAQGLHGQVQVKLEAEESSEAEMKVKVESGEEKHETQPQCNPKPGGQSNKEQPEVKAEPTRQSSNASHPKLTIVLFSVDCENRPTDLDTMKTVLVNIKEDHRAPLIILGQGNVDKDRHKMFCAELGLDHSSQQRGVYYQPSGEYSVSCVDKETLEARVINIVSRMMPCVLTPKIVTDEITTDGKILLVSWHGPQYVMSDEHKIFVFRTLVHFVEHLNKTTLDCKMVIMGGDFNLSYDKTRMCLLDIEQANRKQNSTQPCDGEQEGGGHKNEEQDTKEQKGKVQKAKGQHKEQKGRAQITRRQKHTELSHFSIWTETQENKAKVRDFIVCWPQDKISPSSIECLSKRYEKEMGYWPFDHKIFAFSFQKTHLLG